MSRCMVSAGILILSLATFAVADELSGKLVRVDLDYVTVVGKDDREVKLNVDRSNRSKAAPFIGMWVKIDTMTDNGKLKALDFKSAQ